MSNKVIKREELKELGRGSSILDYSWFRSNLFLQSESEYSSLWCHLQIIKFALPPNMYRLIPVFNCRDQSSRQIFFFYSLIKQQCLYSFDSEVWNHFFFHLVCRKYSHILEVWQICFQPTAIKWSEYGNKASHMNVQ